MLCRSYYSFDQNPPVPSCHIRLIYCRTTYTCTHTFTKTLKVIARIFFTYLLRFLLHAISYSHTAYISSVKMPSLLPLQSFYTCCLLAWNDFPLDNHRLSFCLNVTSSENMLVISIRNIWPSLYIPHYLFWFVFLHSTDHYMKSYCLFFLFILFC